MKRLYLPAIIIALSSSPAIAQTQKVDIEGKTYRVTKAHGEIIVGEKSFMVRKSPELKRRMMLAVKQVTSCELVDDVWTGNLLRGNLKCADGQQPTGPAEGEM